MLILAFETSAKAASVALLQEQNLLAEYYQNNGQTHSRTLMKMADDMLQNCDLSPAQIDAVAVAAGPGSFTGVRIGVAAAKGFAWGKDIPCYGVSTLEAMAYGFEETEYLICAAMDARRSQVYNALFQWRDGCLVRLCPDRAISLEILQEDLKNYPKNKIFVGDGAALCYNTVSLYDKTAKLASEHRRMQRASGVALAARAMMLRGEMGDAASLIPNYLRLSQAERERLERNENKE